jgi:sugar phosphate isomerase/epimerase
MPGGSGFLTKDRMSMKLACQENLIPGDGLEEKWALIRELGFDAIELKGTGDFGLAARIDELRLARARGVQFSSVCVAMTTFIGDIQPEERQDAIANIKSQLSIIAELGGSGVVTPASYGKFSRVLPSRTTGRSAAEDREILAAALRELGEHAASEGVVVFVEPLNRYEDSMVNSLADAAGLCAQAAVSSVKVMADLYHMNIEEADPLEAITAFGPQIAHLHIADSNRQEPGAGHTDFARIFEALRAVSYDAFVALECRPAQAPLAALRDTARLFERLAATGPADPLNSD